MKKNYALIVISFLCFVLSGYGQVTLHSETFEGAQNVGYTSTGIFSDGSNDYFDLIGDATDPTGVPGYTGFGGTKYWAGEDTQDGGNPNGSGISTMAITGINISGYSSIEILGLFGAGSSSAYDDDDYIQVYRQVDGAGYILVGAFEGAGGFNTTLNLDTNLDGEGNGTSLITALQQFAFPIGTTGSTLDLRIDVFMSAGDEAIAFDNIEVEGISSCTPPADPTGTISGTTPVCSNTTLTYTGTPAAGTINYWQNSASGTATTNNATGTFNATTTGTYYIRAYDTTAMCWSNGNLNYTVVINSIPTISTQPVNQNEVIPNTATFSVTSADATSYQWQVNSGTGWGDVTNGTGGTTDTYTTIATSVPMDNNQYRCVLTNTCGDATSNPATLILTVLADVVITEIMYNTPTPGNDYEWIEICNINGTSQDISNYTIDVNGTTRFTFPGSTSILPNSCITILLGDDGSSSAECGFMEDFGSPSGTNILLNGGATITLESPANGPIDSVSYDNADSNATDGNGSSFHVIDATLDNSDTDTNWQAVSFGGSPGDNALTSPCAVFAPDIDIERNTFTSIPDGSLANTGFDTVFLTTAVGDETSPKTYYIRNEGNLDLTITSISLNIDTNFRLQNLPSLPLTIAPSDPPVAFEVVFQPQNPIGTKTDIIEIISDDPDPLEATYTFEVEGEAICSATSFAIFPSSGPAGTVVTIDGAGFDGSTTIDYNGNVLPVTLIDANTIEVTIPSSSTSGDLELTDALGCKNYSYFTVINAVFGGCQGSSTSSDLILYELYDEDPGNGGMITIYNGTNTTLDLSDYKISRTTNYSNQVTFPYVANWYLPSGNLAPGEVFRLKISTSSCSDAFYTTPYDVISATGFNADDGIQLRLTDNTVIDEVLTPNFTGYYMKRNNGTLNPSPTYNNTFWNIDTLSPDECRVVGISPALPANPPTITAEPIASASSCEFTASFTVSATEGVANGLPLAYQWYVSAPGDIGWTALTNDTIYSGTTSATLNISNAIGFDDYQYYCQVREDNVTCYTASNAIKIPIQSTVWYDNSGTPEWSNGAPDINTIAVLDFNYDTTSFGSFSACKLVVNTGALLVINNTTFVLVNSDLTVDGNLIVRPYGSFVQNNDAGLVLGNVLTTPNKIIVEKRTAILNAPDEYAYWSTPVSGESIGAGLNESAPNRRFLFDSRNYLDSEIEINNNNSTNAGQDDIDDNGNDWQQVSNSSTVMTPGVGYAATHSIIGYTGPGNQYVYTFEGPFNTGVINPPVYRNDAEIMDNNWNFIGNPYPSAISFTDFMDVNRYDSLTNTLGVLDGAIYFWSHNTGVDDQANGNEVLNYAQSDYAVLNGSGGTAGGDSSNIPNQFIPSGQGFFVSMSQGTSNWTTLSGMIRTADVIFNNSMRVTGDNNQFFRNSNNNELNKLRINLTSDNGVFNQILVSYINGASDENDGKYYDAPRNMSTGANSILYSVIENNNEKFAIQGKSPSSLNLDEVIPLGFFTAITQATIYTLSIANLEGDFLSNNTIYIKDNLLNSIHNLTEDDYNFTSETGEFNTRFEIVFQSELLSIGENEIDSNGLTILELQNGNVKFSVANTLRITSVEIIDLLGRTLYNLKGNNSSEIFELDNLSQTVYIAKVSLSNGQTITKRAIKRK